MEQLYFAPEKKVYDSKIYLKNCSRCDKTTEQVIYLVSRKRGAKFKCLACRHISSRYTRDISKFKTKFMEVNK